MITKEEALELAAELGLSEDDFEEGELELYIASVQEGEEE